MRCKMIGMLLTIVSLVFAHDAQSQQWEKVISESSNETFSSVAIDPAGGYLVTGYSDDNSSFLFHIDSLGNIDWNKTYSSGSANVSIKDIIVTSNGDFVLGGENHLFKTNNVGSISLTKNTSTTISILELGANEIYTVGWENIIKWDGNTLDSIWSRSMVAQSFSCNLKGLTELSDGNILLYGSEGNGGYKSMLKINTLGDTIWSFAEGGQGCLAGPGTGGFTNAKGFSDGTILACDKNGNLLKLDQNGQVLWFNDYSSSYALSWSKIIGNSNSGFFCAGTINGQGNGGDDFILMKFDGGGNILGVNTYGSALSETLMGAVLNDTTGQILLVGKTLGFGSVQEDAYIICTDLNGFNSCNTFQGNLNSTSNSFSDCYNIGGQSSSVTYSSASLTENSLTPNDSLLCSSVGIAENLISNKNLLIYPNPASSYVKIDLQSKNHFISQVEIYSILGSHLDIKYTAGVVDFSPIPPGVYYFKFMLSNGQTITKKVIKN
ncbi:MAG: hypothetical protein COB15_12290 [Flavobacteriales bacterium]|nr:MAG: hypothetical protein COB15_12290 [Flavobacteriales bacterium]